MTRIESRHLDPPRFSDAQTVVLELLLLEMSAVVDQLRALRAQRRELRTELKQACADGTPDPVRSCNAAARLRDVEQQMRQLLDQVAQVQERLGRER